MSSEFKKVDFQGLFRDLRRHVEAGRALHEAGRRDTDVRFLELFAALDKLLTSAQENQEKLASGAASFDFIKADGSHVCGNGYRSLLFLLASLLSPLLHALQKHSREGRSWFFRPTDHITTLTDYCRALQGMELYIRNAVVLMEESSAAYLFAGSETNEKLKRVMCVKDLCRDVFYGKLLGFQYDSSLKPVLKSIALGMACYEKWFHSEREEPIKKMLQSVQHGTKYVQSPHQLGLKLDYLTQETSIHFVKEFWSLLEQDTIKGAVKVISPRVDVSQWLEVPSQDVVLQGATGPVTISLSSRGLHEWPPEQRDRPIPLLLISNKRRTTQGNRRVATPPARGLVIHMHGGGFVAQSPKSHEYYLRKWSKELDCPVVSIAYSLAPEAPYPHALEECLLAYVWVLNHLEAIGSTGERIVLAGDSAGGQLAITVAMKLKQLGLRLPDRILSAYPALNCTTTVSPSKFVALVDPLLPLGVLISILQAVTGNVPDAEELQTRRDHRRKIHTSLGQHTSDRDSHHCPEEGSKSNEIERHDPKEAESNGGASSVDTSNTSRWSFLRRKKQNTTESVSSRKWWQRRKQVEDEEEEEDGGGHGLPNGGRRSRWSFRSWRNKHEVLTEVDDDGKEISRSRRRWTLNRFSFRLRNHSAEASNMDDTRPPRRSWSFRKPKKQMESDLYESSDPPQRQRGWSFRKRKKAEAATTTVEGDRPPRMVERFKLHRMPSAEEYRRLMTSVSGEPLLPGDTGDHMSPPKPEPPMLPLPVASTSSSSADQSPTSTDSLVAVTTPTEESAVATISTEALVDIEPNVRSVTSLTQNGEPSPLTIEPLFDSMDGLLATILGEGGAASTLLEFETRPATSEDNTGSLRLITATEGDTNSKTHKPATDNDCNASSLTEMERDSTSENYTGSDHMSPPKAEPPMLQLPVASTSSSANRPPSGTKPLVAVATSTEVGEGGAASTLLEIETRPATSEDNTGSLTETERDADNKALGAVEALAGDDTVEREVSVSAELAVVSEVKAESMAAASLNENGRREEEEEEEKGGGATANGVICKVDDSINELQQSPSLQQLLAQANQDTPLPPELEPLLEEVIRGYRDYEVTKDSFLSPLFSPPELLTGLPPIHLVAAALDPLLDDSVEMAKKLQSIGQPVTLDVIEGVPHGFLSFMTARRSAELERGQRLCVDYCREGLS